MQVALPYVSFNRKSLPAIWLLSEWTTCAFSTCQLNSTEELQRATFGKGRMVSQNMLRDQEEDVASLYNRMLWISTLSSVVSLHRGGRSGDPHIARRCQQGMKYLVFLQGLIGLLTAFSILSRSDKTIWGAETQEGQIYLSKWLNRPKGFLRTQI